MSLVRQLNSRETTSCLSQFYVLHSVEQGTLLLLHIGSLRPPLHFQKQKINYHNRGTAARYSWGDACCYTVLRMRKGKVKQEAKHRISAVLQNSLKYTASFPVVCGDC